MTRFDTIIARLCAQSGAAYLHIDCPPGLAPKEMAASIGEANLAMLDEDQEVQILAPGDPAQAGAGARKMFSLVTALMTRDGVQGANVVCITSSGEVTSWRDGRVQVERLPEEDLLSVFRQRNANAIASAG